MMRAWGQTVVALAVAATIATGAPIAAFAASRIPERTTGFDRVGPWVTVSVGLQDLLSAEARQHLTSGFATRVLLRVFLYQGDAREPVATAFRQAEIVYDIWEEKFRILTLDHEGRSVMAEAPTLPDAVDRSTALWRFPIAPVAALLPGASYRVGVRGDLNPLSEDLVADVRRRLVRPQSSRGRFGGDSFFGSFINIFINPRIEESEHQVRFLSQEFVPAALSDATPRGAR